MREGSHRRAARGAWLALLGVSAGLVCAPTVRAQDPIHKMKRGVANVLTGWMEVPKQVHYGRHAEHAILGFGRGLLKGAGLAIIRSGVGVYETLTFPLPYPTDFASPYTPMEMRDYAWE